MAESSESSHANIDRLGDRLKENIIDEDLGFLDKYRRSFRSAYDQVVTKIKDELKA